MPRQRDRGDRSSASNEDKIENARVDQDIRNRQAQRKAGDWSNKAYMTQLGHESVLQQQGEMSGVARAAMSNQAASDARRVKTAKEYKGAK